MRKSTLFISAALTTFMLAILFGVVSAYQNIVKSTPPVAEQPLPTAEVAMVNAPIPTQVTIISPEEAASLASQVINRTDLFSAEVTQFEGVDVYLITFSSGDLVYVSMDGQIVSISKIVVTVVSQPRRRNNNNDQNNAVASSEHEDGEHEEGGDD